MSIRVLHVSNISPYATKEQIQTLFGYVGRIEEFKLYPTDFLVAQASQQAKFAYVKFENESGVDVGQHLTNTVFLDRALVCIPATSNTIPDEEAAIQGGALALPGQRQLPPHISNQVQDIGDGQKMIVTIDPTFASLGLPAYPPLPPTTEPSKVEEIRRTVYVGNLPKGCDGEQLLNFFNACIGEVMYLRMAAGNEYLPCDYAYVEFSQQSSVPLALQNSDSLEFQGRILRIQHSKVAIIKPQRKTAEQSLEEVEEAIRGGAIGGTMDLGRGYSPHAAGAVHGVLASAAQSSSTNLRSSRSPASSSTKKRSRSRSRSRSIRRRRSRSRSRSSSYSRIRRRRSRSRSRSRSRDGRSSRKRSSSRRRSRSKKRSSVEKSKKKKRSRSRDRSPVGKSSKREKEKERSSKKEKEGNSSSGKKERKKSRSRSVKKEKEREEKSSKKSKRTSEDSPKKATKKETTAGTDSESTSTRTDIEAPSPMDISPPKKLPKQEPSDSNMEEEENLRERLLEKVKIKHQQQQKDESNDEE